MPDRFARLAHGSATPATLDLILRRMDEAEEVPGPMHRTAGGGRLSYVIGVRVRRAAVTFALLSATEKADFLSFFRSVKLANTRFTFQADYTNHPFDSWSAFFVSLPKFDRRQMPGASLYDEVTIDIEDAPVTL